MVSSSEPYEENAKSLFHRKGFDNLVLVGSEMGQALGSGVKPMHHKRGFYIAVPILIAALLCAHAALPQASKPSKFGGDPDAHPPVTKDDLRIVQRARQILDNASKWNRADTRECPKDAKTFSLYCALEQATQEVTGSFQHRGAAMQEARFAIDKIAPNRSRYHHRLMDYNNDPSTTFADIQKVFSLMEQGIADQLKRARPERP